MDRCRWETTLSVLGGASLSFYLSLILPPSLSPLSLFMQSIWDNPTFLEGGADLLRHGTDDGGWGWVQDWFGCARVGSWLAWTGVAPPINLGDRWVICLLSQRGMGGETADQWPGSNRTTCVQHEEINAQLYGPTGLRCCRINGRTALLHGLTQMGLDQCRERSIVVLLNLDYSWSMS